MFIKNARSDTTLPEYTCGEKLHISPAMVSLAYIRIKSGQSQKQYFLNRVGWLVTNDNVEVKGALEIKNATFSIFEGTQK